MEAANKFAVFEGGARTTRRIPFEERPGLWQLERSETKEPKSVIGLLAAVGFSLSVWGAVGIALLT